MANGVDVTHVRTDPNTSSGVALITVDEAGENSIIIVPGANGQVDDEEIERFASIIEPRDIVLMQLELPLSTVMAAAAIAAHKKATLILDPAPAQFLPDNLFALADIITPNETEASFLTDRVLTNDTEISIAIETLHRRGCRQILLKRGSAGAVWSRDSQRKHLAPYKVHTIDTVAAGDACNGGIAAGLWTGLPISDALQWGMAAGALATTKRGAQLAMPSQNELNDLLSRYPPLLRES